MAKIDLGSTVTYIFNNYETLKQSLSKKELIKLQQMLELASIQVESKIIENALNKDSDISMEIEETKKYIESRLADLERQKAELESKSEYPEFQAEKKDESVPDFFQQQVEEKKRENYSEAKKIWETKDLPQIEREIVELQRQIIELTSLQQHIDSPEGFVEKFVSKRYGKASQIKIKELCDYCATTMADSYMSMEKSPIDGKHLFTHIDTSNFKGYVPDFKRVEAFLGVIRNPDLCRELDDYGSFNLNVNKKEKEKEEAHDLLKYYDLVSNALNKDLIRTEVEGDISRLAELKNLQSEINSKKYALTEKPKGFMGFIRSFLNRKGNQQKLGEIYKQESQVTGELQVLYRKEIAEKIHENTDYALIYDFYMGHDLLEEEHTGFYDKMPEDVERAVYLAKDGKSIGMRKSAEASGDLNTKITNVRLRYENVKQELDGMEAERAQKYDALSPEAKVVVDGNKDYSLTDLTEKYVKAKGAERYGNSPLVASLILEGVMRARKIETPEDAEKVGLTLSDEQMEQIKANGGKLKGDLISWLQEIRDRDQIR